MTAAKRKIASGDEWSVLGARVKLTVPSCQVAAVAMVPSGLTVFRVCHAECTQVHVSSCTAGEKQGSLITSACLAYAELLAAPQQAGAFQSLI